LKHPNDAEWIAGSRVIKLGRGEGQQVQLGNIGFTWKARGEDTGYQISMYEMTLAPQVGIPLHEHPYPEVFYVLEGQIDFARMTSEGMQEWIPCDAGESVVVSPNAPHTFFNHSDQPAKFLSFSNYQHEAIFKDFEVDGMDLSAPPDLEQFAHFGEVALKNHGHNVEP
jgi:quercetin dioxygenase-like cupin family protein